MPTYEVTYRVGEQTRTATVEASGPVAAERRFREQSEEQQLDILCVVRQ